MKSLSQSSDQSLEALRFIAETHRRIFDRRAERTTKLVFTTLTFYVLAVGARFAAENPASFEKALSSNWIQAIIWLVFVGTALFVAKALMNAAKADCINRTIAERAENAIMDLIKRDHPQVTLIDALHSNPNSLYLRSNMLIVILFSVASAFMVTQS